MNLVDLFFVVNIPIDCNVYLLKSLVGRDIYIL